MRSDIGVYAVAPVVTAALLGFFPRTAFACEPLVPLVMLFAGPHFITGSILGFVVAVGLKCGVFAFFASSLPTGKAMWYMFVANVVTTFVGVFVTAAIAMPWFLFALPLIYVLTFYPARRLTSHRQYARRMPLGPHALSLVLLLLLLATYVLFALALSVRGEQLVLYWVLKLAYIYPALAISIGLTTLWEEWLVYRLARGFAPLTPFYPAVLRANLVTLLVLVGAAAVMALPKRLASPDFLL